VAVTLALAACLMAAVVVAQQTAFAFATITVADTAIAIPNATRHDSVQGYATYCAGRLEGGPIRYRYDGGTPTAAVGELLYEDERIEILGSRNILRFSAIRTTGVSGSLSITCGR